MGSQLAGQNVRIGWRLGLHVPARGVSAKVLERRRRAMTGPQTKRVTHGRNSYLS
jgi:hypothetical protein